jgi:UPF0042 nucleotide-binding protein
MSTRRKKAEAKRAGAPDIVVITGLSGSGMSSATNAFEDLGYFCVDNLPLTLLPTFARLVRPNEDEEQDEAPYIRRAALVIDIREGHFLSEFEGQLGRLRGDSGLSVFVLFFEASDEALQRRFSETRRPHPFDTGDGLAASISAERAAMAEIRNAADLIIDTSEHTVHSLRRYLVERFSPDTRGTPMRVQVVSFGHKYGAPRDLDLLFDVRHLPNPHFVPELRALTGRDPAVIEHVEAGELAREYYQRLLPLLDFLLPAYLAEGKTHLTIAIGCTGGRHRSLTVADRIAEHLANHEDISLRVVHRDVELD